jgi:hypothetical protein
MAPSQPDPEVLLRQGSTVLNKGRHREAADIFRLIITMTGGTAPAEAYQQLGICLRLLQEHGGAEGAFRTAFFKATSEFHAGQILRDWAMCDLDRRDFVSARDHLEHSCRLLAYSGPKDASSSQEMRVQRRIEYFVTVGILARYFALLGGGDNYKTARVHYRTVDVELSNTAPYELNNLVWWLKIEMPKKRYKLGRRAFRLARVAGNSMRQVEIVLIVISPSLAKLATPYLRRILQRVKRKS